MVCLRNAHAHTDAMRYCQWWPHQQLEACSCFADLLAAPEPSLVVLSSIPAHVHIRVHQRLGSPTFTRLQATRDFFTLYTTWWLSASILFNRVVAVLAAPLNGQAGALRLHQQEGGLNTTAIHSMLQLTWPQGVPLSAVRPQS